MRSRGERREDRRILLNLIMDYIFVPCSRVPVRVRQSDGSPNIHDRARRTWGVTNLIFLDSLFCFVQRARRDAMGRELPSEIVALILSFLAPRQLRSHRRRLTRLPASSDFTPLIQQRLFYKLCWFIGKDGFEQLPTIVKNAGAYVRYFKILSPERTGSNVDWEALPPGTDPGSLLSPGNDILQQRSVEIAAQAFGKMKFITHLDIETRVGMLEEDNTDGDDADEEALMDFGQALSMLSGLEAISFAVMHPRKKLNILATPLYSSPYLRLIAQSSHLRSLDLWRIKFELDPITPHPGFRLSTLILSDCALGGEVELDWLIGYSEGDRSARLETLELKNLDLTNSATTSDPITTLFHSSTAIPPFASSLQHLVIELAHPLTTPIDLSHFHSLKTLELGGPSLSPSTFTSLIPTAPLFRPVVPQLSSLILSHTPEITFIDMATALPLLPSLDLLQVVSDAHVHRSLPWNTPAPRWDWGDESIIKRAAKLARVNKIDFELKLNGRLVNAETEEEEELESEGEGAENSSAGGLGDEMFYLSSDEEEAYAAGKAREEVWRKERAEDELSDY